ncbi:HtrA protease/chaperone protein [Caenispirillum salinarum AK4]|uniref:Probable periplasmic serine endoprotease DegP-like n=1 Tax=Caenispirillum salinarum AK4 TaxID=1238182 RepID=K9GMW2_9PROT|nr:DegQ family serine endoprotease [Caenispirillum salinarum]EKV27330.1 HtrA protease/chaperone protein [Caenispirillum salinarum AK4]
MTGSIRTPIPAAGRWLSALVVVGALMLGAAAQQPAQAQNGAPASFADMAERLLPAVVNISTTTTLGGERGPQMPQFPPGSPFEDFFREFFDRQQAPSVPRRATSLGSGFVIDGDDGYIVTNNHVIEGAEEVTVILQDDTALTAEVIGRDPKTDVAVLKVDNDEELPSVQWGDSDTARVGDWVIAIGNPFGLGGTVTAGIISARARNINAGPYDNFIQTDASINRGNSGGPLFDMDGRVVGVNTAIYSPAGGGSVGIGFATPSNLARNVVEDLIEYGEVKRGWLGVRIQTVTDEIADSLGLEGAQGALVASVQPDGPAAAAGIQPGDVILRWDDQAINEMRNLPKAVAETEIGRTVDVIVWRDGERRTIDVEVAELQEEEAAAFAGEPNGNGPTPEQTGSEVPALGLSVQPLDLEARETYGIPDDVQTGVVVSDLSTDSDAAQKGIRPGDVIAEVNQTRVSSAAEIREQVAQARDNGRKSVLLMVQGDTGSRFVAVRIGEEG